MACMVATEEFRTKKVQAFHEFIATYANILESFCKGLVQDREAVLAAMTTHYSSGIVEGNNCRFKLLKRVGYGRAGLELLERRMVVTHLLV